MYKQTAALLTASIDEITRKWVEDLRRNSRTEVHKHLLTADIVDGVKAMLASLAKAIEAHEVPEDEAELAPPLRSSPDPRVPRPEPFGTDSGRGTLDPGLRKARGQPVTTRPLYGPLSQAREGAASLGRLRHTQAYEIQEVIYEYVKLRQEVLDTVRSPELLRQSSAPETLAYVDRLLDELLLTTVENFYNVSLRDLEKRAIRDPTTQLYNKDFFHQRLNEELRRAIRYAQPIAVAMLDMDKLKTINDTYGHAAGDEAIRVIGKVIHDTVRQADVPCRYGGDEFAVILPETSKVQALAFAERVLRAMSNLSFVVVPGHAERGERAERTEPSEQGGEPVVASEDGAANTKNRSHGAVVIPAPTVSIGVAAFPEDARNPETLLARADAALYRAKNEGRNRVSD